MRLAEASCTEGCCGALCVTIQRDGDYVLWDEWRNHDEDEVDLPASERLAEQLVAADPRQAAEVCRGSTDFARQPAPYQATFPLLRCDAPLGCWRSGASR
ncbi:hypothetical protein ACH4PR_46710 [Streptomyces mirabilis]|uniref:hypothetical protein n=1 Tax=Streptomyces mirabilis TaxID=68239 RepID=UPI003797B07D